MQTACLSVLARSHACVSSSLIRPHLAKSFLLNSRITTDAPVPISYFGLLSPRLWSFSLPGPSVPRSSLGTSSRCLLGFLPSLSVFRLDMSKPRVQKCCLSVQRDHLPQRGTTNRYLRHHFLFLFFLLFLLLRTPLHHILHPLCLHPVAKAIMSSLNTPPQQPTCRK